METQNIILALRLANSVLGEISRIVEKAQNEGRDVTDEELDAARARSQAALDAWTGEE